MMGMLELVGDDVLVELLYDGSEDGSGGVRAGGIASEARDLDEVDPVVCGEEFCFGGVDVARTGEAGDEDDVGAIAWRDSLNDDGEAGRGGDDALAEYWFSQQQNSGEEEKKSDDAKDRAGNWPWISSLELLQCAGCDALSEWFASLNRDDSCHGLRLFEKATLHQ